MRIGVVGAGYVGLVVGACLPETGNTVVCVDKDEAKTLALRAGRIPIYEPGLNGRNIFNPTQVKSLGFQYEGIGRR